MTVYMQVTPDKLELPVAVANSVNELSRMTGKDEKTIRSAISHVKSGRRKSSIYLAIEIEEGNEEDGD